MHLKTWTRQWAASKPLSGRRLGIPELEKYGSDKSFEKISLYIQGKNFSVTCAIVSK